MNTITEVLTGIVSRVTYHNPATGWSVLRVQPFQSPQQQETVTVHQTKVFAGATMEFRGAWTIDHKYGRQFKATEAIEKKPATTASIEKYLGSGLIKGVGPQTAKQIVKYFQKDTLAIFENEIQRLTEVPGIAKKKLQMIEQAWTEHRAIREVMMFLQGHGISTLFAVRIYKEYGDKAIAMVTEDPYRLANDIYGIGFFSADKVALSIGLTEDSQPRMLAAIKHVLAASREQGHCYLTEQQINTGIIELIAINLGERLKDYLGLMQQAGQLCTRFLNKENVETIGYYSKTLFYDETAVATILRGMQEPVASEPERIAQWVTTYCQHKHITLSNEQAHAVNGVVQQRFSILTGGPGCGKTTTTLVIVRLLEAMNKTVLLAAPTGRASQRMSEVIGREAKTIHRLLEWKGGEFQMNDWKNPELENLVADQSYQSPFEFRIEEAIKSAYEVDFVVPDKFKHVDIEQLTQTEAQVDALKAVVKKIHPWSSLHYGLSAVYTVVKLYLEWIPKYHGQDTEVQILTPMTRGSLGSAHLNQVIQAKANPPTENKCQLKVGERLFREGDRVIHRRNNYDLNVFNGDIGKIVTIDNEELTAVVTFYPDHRTVQYKKEDMMELDLAYAITIHKSQGSEFKAVIIPILSQHFKMLYRNLIYTGLTRAKNLAVFVGTRKALATAIRQQDVSQRQTALEVLIKA